MLCMSSAERGTFWVNIPEEATTLELDHRQLRELIGPTSAKEYMHCHDPIACPEYWCSRFRIRGWFPMCAGVIGIPATSGGCSTGLDGMYGIMSRFQHRRPFKSFKQLVLVVASQMQ